MTSSYADALVPRTTEQTGVDTGVCLGYTGIISRAEIAVERGTVGTVNLKTSVTLEKLLFKSYGMYSESDKSRNSHKSLSRTTNFNMLCPQESKRKQIILSERALLSIPPYPVFP